MKRLLSYTFLMVLSSFVVSSCITEKFDDGKEPLQTSLSLQLCFPDDGTKAPSDPLLPGDGSSTTTPDGLENPINPYENTIPSEKDIRIFIFNYDDGTFIGEPTDLQLKFGAEAKYKKVQGIMPEKVKDGTHVRLVFMANYEYRMNAEHENPLKTPASDMKYEAWKSSIHFDYSTQYNGSLSTQKKDNLLIPMSGETDFIVYANQDNIVRVDVTRALSKVRLTVKQGSAYGIKDIMVHGTQGLSYCFERKDKDGNVLVPTISGFGCDRDFTGHKVKPLDLNSQDPEHHPFEFYVSEQSKNAMYITFNLYDLKDENKVQPAQVTFKDYTHGTPYPVERNYIYVFNINKKQTEDSKVDITTTIQPWEIVELNTDFI